MKRKIIKQGHNTLTVTLPNKWVKRLNLKAGEETDVIENGNTLVINGKQSQEEKCCIIDITDFTIPLLWRYFQSAYRSGYTEIKIIFDSNKNLYEDAFHYYTTQFDYKYLGEKIPPKPAIAMIQEVVNRFIGIDIMESGKGYCVIKEMAEVSSKEFENSLRRIFLVIFELFDRVIESIEKDEIDNTLLCKEIHAIDLNIDKFVDYCARILNRVVDVAPEKKKSLIFSSLFILELIGDEFKYIAKHIALSKKSVKDSAKIASSVRNHFDTYYKLYYKFDRKTAIQFGEDDIGVYQEHFGNKEKLKGESKSIERHFMMISKFTLALTELRIQMELS